MSSLHLDDSQAHLLIVHIEQQSPVKESKSKISVRNLTKVLPTGVEILCGVNVEIPGGAIVGIIGPSCWPETPRWYAFSGTVADNIRYGPQLRGKKLSDNEVYKFLSLADLEPSFYSKIGNELSIGQAQRVALARTLANEPEVLLLDEPTSALDPISTQNIEDALVKLKKNRGMTTIMVSHSIKQIKRIADVVCLLVNGEIVEVLKPDKLYEAAHPMAQKFLQLSA